MFSLAPLPFAKNALSPFISSETIEYHYGKHHQAYVNKLNDLVKETDFEGRDLEYVVLHAEGPIFNNAAQIWNHNFYWQCLTTADTSEITGKLAAAIDQKFGSFAKFKVEFKEKALANFGSGWTWLVLTKDNNLEIENTSNAQNPLTAGKKPLFTCDVWEHAYYIDYRNDRGKYLDNFWRLVNWGFVAKNY